MTTVLVSDLDALPPVVVTPLDCLPLTDINLLELFFWL